MKPPLIQLSRVVQKLPLPFETKREVNDYLFYLRAKNILRNRDNHDVIFVDAARTLVAIRDEEKSEKRSK